MIGTIRYLRELNKICTAAGGDCWSCPMGRAKEIKNTLCPRLTEPRTWSKEKTTAMAKAIKGIEKNESQNKK